MKTFKFLTDNNDVEDTTIERHLPSFYNIDGFICVGVTPRRTNPDTYEPYRHLVYEEITSGRMTQANIINTEHPMYNYYREIEPEFYNSRYVDVSNP